jgi:hypothetical protein
VPCGDDVGFAVLTNSRIIYTGTRTKGIRSLSESAGARAKNEPQASGALPGPDVAAPRLPPAKTVMAPPVAPVNSGATAPASLPAQSAAKRALLSGEDFVEPTLESSIAGNRLVLMARVVAMLWAFAVGFAALATRSRAADGFDDGSLVTGVGRLGIGVGALVLGVGMIWSDRRVRNVKLLDGRRPTRPRCISAWVTPGVVAGLLAVTIVRLEPNELFDARPPIIVLVFAVAMWRPYALIRRILTTLTRVSSDPLLGIAYVLDLAAFGLLWWQLTEWPATVDRSGSSVDILVGVGFAAAVALGANVFVWRMILGAADAAEAYRLTQLGTRHDHRVLRLRGIDPSNPEVWWELVQRHVERQRTSGRLAEGGAPVETERPVEPAVPVTSLIAQVRAENRVALRQLGDEGSSAVIAQLRSRFGPESDFHSVESPDRQAALPARLAQAARPPQPSAAALPLSSLRRRLGNEEGHRAADGDGTLRRLVSSAGRAEIDAALARRTGEGGDEPRPRTEPPRLYQLEGVRYLLLGAFLAVSGTALWLVSETLDTSVVDDAGRLPLDVVDAVDLARRAMVTALTVALAMVPLWAATVSSNAHRAGVTETRRRSCLVAFVAISALAVISFAVDGDTRGTTSLLLLIPATAIAMWSALTVIRVQRWFGLASYTLAAWTFGLPVLVVISWIGRLQRPVAPTDSLPVLTFFAVADAVIASVLVVVMSLCATEVEDTIRVSPELARPVPVRPGRLPAAPNAAA